MTLHPHRDQFEALMAMSHSGPVYMVNLLQVLMVPATDLTDSIDWPSYQEAGDRYILTMSGLRDMFAAYQPDADARQDPYVSPYFAPDLEELPPAVITTNHFDPLRDQGAAYGQRLHEAGVEVRIDNYPGTLHGFLGSMDKLAQFNRRLVQDLRHYLA